MRRDYGRGKSNSGRIGWWLMATVLILSILVFGWLVFEKGRSKWGENRFYITAVVEDEWIRVVGVNSMMKRAVEVVIPGEVMVPLVGTQGELKVKSLWRFGESEGRPEEMVRRSLESWMGVKIDAVWRGDAAFEWSRVWSGMAESKWDSFSTVKAWNELRDDQRESLRIPSRLTSMKVTPDGQTEVSVDKGGLWAWMEGLWASPAILAESLSFEVVNASGEPGMARLVEQMIKSAGGVVVLVDTAEVEDGLCWYESGGESESVSIDWLERQMGCGERTGNRVGGDVRVVIGKEWAERYR